MFKVSSEKSEMPSVSVEAAQLMRGLVEPAPAGAHVETLIRDAARKVGFGFQRARSIWYREARAILAEEMDLLRAKVAQVREANGNEFQRDYANVDARLNAIEIELHKLRQGMARTPSHGEGASADGSVRSEGGEGPEILAGSRADSPVAGEQSGLRREA